MLEVYKDDIEFKTTDKKCRTQKAKIFKRLSRECRLT